ncbi:MAG TPA: hypothetical protein VGK24_11185 [Candidatus Angelobacter sp.]|jgi:hypothetical protein
MTREQTLLRRKAMTREEILAGLRNCAKKLDRTPTYTEIWRMTKITKHAIKLNFENLSEAMRQAGVVARGIGHRLDTLTLLEDWAHLTRKIARPPSYMEYKRAGNYGANSFLNRCGAWSRVGERFREVVKERNRESAWADVLEIVRQWEGKTTVEGRRKMANRQPSERVVHDETHARRKMLPGRPIYGPPLQMTTLRNAPMTEGGVMYCFGTLAESMGFAVERIQTAFPDCEALREVALGKWQRVRIEFEVFSRSFLDHQHDPKGCDIIICWVHNWPECPEHIEVIELSKIVRGL